MIPDGGDGGSGGGGGVCFIYYYTFMTSVEMDMKCY